MHWGTFFVNQCASLEYLVNSFLFSLKVVEDAEKQVKKSCVTTQSVSVFAVIAIPPNPNFSKTENPDPNPKL